MYYSEEQIDALIQPVVDRQIEINNWVINKIARRIKEIGELLPSDVNSLEQLAKTGADVKAINAKIAEVVKVQIAQIKKVIKKVAENVYTNARPYFDYRQKSFIPFEENEPVQRVVKAIETQTSGTYKNLAKAQAFMTRDPQNSKILRPTPIARTYQNTVDKAIQTVSSGVADYQSVMRESLKEIVDSGIKAVEYNTETGKTYTQRLDTAVRRNLMDGTRAVNQGVQNEIGKQFGANGVEISVHACPAPDHQYVQGHQFPLSEYAKIAPMGTIQSDGSIDNSVYENYKTPKDEDFDESDPNNWVLDTDGRRYARFARRIGTCNCMHFAYNIIVGQAPQNYTDEQLQKILDENKKGVEIDGKHYTKYQATQMQRKLETRIRKAKDRQIAMKEAGDMQEVKKAQDEVTRLNKEYKIFSEKAGLRPKLERTKVEGYKKIKI